MKRSLFVATALFGIACAHAKKQEAPVAEISQPAPKALDNAAPAPSPQSPVVVTSDEGAAKELETALAAVQATAVLFGSDDATLTREGTEKLAAVGLILAKHPKLTVRVEGNCDERGTEGYNIVLGQSRAATARKYLLQMGARDGQVATISFGAERPKVTGHGETAWRQNRRDDIVVTAGVN